MNEIFTDMDSEHKRTITEVNLIEFNSFAKQRFQKLLIYIDAKYQSLLEDLSNITKALTKNTSIMKQNIALENQTNAHFPSESTINNKFENRNHQHKNNEMTLNDIHNLFIRELNSKEVAVYI